MKFVTRSDIGKLREINEDSFLADGRVFAVADGMGGHNAGEIASALALKTFAAAFGPPAPEAPAETVMEILATAVEAANDAVHAAAAHKKAYAGMGTTLTAAYIAGSALFLAQVGDSRAYLLRDGHLTQWTVDHTLVQEMIARGEIDDELARIHPLKHVITRALGTYTTVTADVSRWQAEPGDTVLLCSDGLSAKVEPDVIRDIIVSAATLDSAADKLVEAALDAGGEDNITVVLIQPMESAGA